MRINIDAKALKDPRFKRLGRTLEIDWRFALGICLELWMYCSDAKTDTLAADDIDAVVERDGFADALVAAELAEPLDGAIRVRGVRERIDYLVRQRESASAGGKASAAKRHANKSAKLEAVAQAVAQAPAQATPRRSDLLFSGSTLILSDQGDARGAEPRPEGSRAAEAPQRETLSPAAAPGAWAWRPAPGGQAEKAAKRKIAAGEEALVLRVFRKIAAKEREEGRPFDDARAALWIERERPETPRSRSKRARNAPYQEPPTTDADPWKAPPGMRTIGGKS